MDEEIASIQDEQRLGALLCLLVRVPTEYIYTYRYSLDSAIIPFYSPFQSLGKSSLQQLAGRQAVACHTMEAPIS
jgi:hypothetical protein